ncbi:unnamed protein product [Blepharisma stoltei]|uniref:EF-hand domain-containing protein n=1 Tax=Blepharisma stoltei TaxID=1481888 RepID=A0AAU9JGD5_9CILI|nr:unnamed protein product [Blepharisma stoltei]
MSVYIDYSDSKNLLQALSNKSLRRVKKIGASPFPEPELSSEFWQKTPMRISALTKVNKIPFKNVMHKPTLSTANHHKRLIISNSPKNPNNISIELKEFHNQMRPLSQMRSRSTKSLRHNKSLNSQLDKPLTCSNSFILHEIPQKVKKMRFLQDPINKPITSFKILGQNLNCDTSNKFSYNDIVSFVKNIDINYTKYFEDLSSSQQNENIINEASPQDIVDYLRYTIPNREYWDYENESSITDIEEILQLAQKILKTFDLNSDGKIDKNEFLGVCSVYDFYMSNKPFNLRDEALLNEIQVKLQELKKLFRAYTDKDAIPSNAILNLFLSLKIFCSDIQLIHKIRSTKITFAVFLRWIGFFVKVHKCVIRLIH